MVSGSQTDTWEEDILPDFVELSSWAWANSLEKY